MSTSSIDAAAIKAAAAALAGATGGWPTLTNTANDSAVTMFIFVSSAVGLIFSLFLYSKVSCIEIEPGKESADKYTKSPGVTASQLQNLHEIYGHIRGGAKSFLIAEYKICAIFLVVFGATVVVLCAQGDGGWNQGIWTGISFLTGGITSMACGYLGMMVAVFSNARTSVSAIGEGAEGTAGWTQSFNCAFRAGGVMGFSLTAIALAVCYVLSFVLTTQYDSKKSKDLTLMFEALSGFGLGGSSIAMFGRVGGGIYTKAADVGADLAGKVVENIPEDDPRNPATIADNVGDNVGDVAGMGSDLFGSFAEASCAALVLASSSRGLSASWSALFFPLVINAAGIFVCMVCSFIATNIDPVKKQADVERVLKIQLFVTSLAMTVVLYFLAAWILPATFEVGGIAATPVGIFGCAAAGLWSGCAIGFITEYYTSASYQPVQTVAYSCKTGAATNIIYGLALGYKSLIAPISLIALTTFISFRAAGMYGIATAALGMLSTLSTCLTIDVYGPVCDNAGGIAEMAELPSYVRDRTDALDAAGNTTAAIGKGFAIGSAALVALALFGAFITRAGTGSVNILKPIVFAWIFMGAMIPYWFTAMTMKSVGEAAMAMVEEVAHQFKTKKGLLAGTPGHEPADHDRCIKISTDASLREMILPGLLVILSPILTGSIFGIEAVAGLLTGSITSGVQLAISQSNTGGAWDNAKKFVEAGQVKIDGKVHGKGSEIHKAAVTGDTVGDPLKDTSGPAINIVMKLQAIIALVFCDFFLSINGGRGAFNLK